MDLLRSSLSPGEEQEFAAHRPVHHGEDDAQEQMQSSYLDDQQHFSQNSFAEALLFAQVLYLPCSYSLLLSLLAVCLAAPAYTSMNLLTKGYMLVSGTGGGGSAAQLRCAG